jgi:hypothetical protein
MSRDLSTYTLQALEEEVFYPFFAVELLFDDNIVRTWTGVGLLTLEDGTEWYGAGQLLEISSVEETQEMAAKGATVTMSGIPSELLSLALQEPYQGRVCNIYFGNFTRGRLLQEGGAFILFEDGSKIGLQAGKKGFNQMFSGYMDQMNIEEGPQTSTIELTVENKLINLERARVARFTSGYQKSKFAGDKGLDFIESMQDKTIPWGKSE